MSNQYDEPLDMDEREPDSFTREELLNAIQNYDAQRQRFDVAPTTQQLLGRFTIFCLIMNRTIGSGIFTQPVNVLFFTGSSGLALLLWCLDGVVILCVVACWIELALSVPIHSMLWNGRWTMVSTPRSGGDKNYLEYIYKRPKFLMKCVFGITFIIFSNLSGNAIQFGVFMMTAIRNCQEETCYSRGEVVAWAVSVLTFCAFLNIFTRRYAIGINNILAVFKISLVIVMAFTGIIYGSVHGDGCRQISWQAPAGSEQGQLGDIVLALFYAMYPYTGYEQPFYVLAEVSRPGRVFAKAATVAMLTTVVLFPLVNVSYLCMSPYSGNSSLPPNMALAFFTRLSNSSDPNGGSGPVQGVSVLLAIFIFGNLLAQTYTASRVKQEIAKEGILPWSLILATGSDTIISRLFTMGRPQRSAVSDIEGHREQAPIAATILHWAVEVTLVLVVGLALPPSQAYNFLTYVYTFAIVGFLGVLTAGGLLYLKLDSFFAGMNGRNWRERAAWKPWLDPLPSIIAATALLFVLFASFVSPSRAEPNSLPYYVGPAVGWASGALGVLWWLGLRYAQWHGRWELKTRRVPYIDFDEEGNPIQRAELVQHERVPVAGRRR